MKQLVKRGHGVNLPKMTISTNTRDCALPSLERRNFLITCLLVKAFPVQALRVCVISSHTWSLVVWRYIFPSKNCPNTRLHNSSTQSSSHLLKSTAILKNNTHISYAIILKVQYRNPNIVRGTNIEHRIHIHNFQMINESDNW